MEVLAKRHIRESRSCAICGGEEETIVHALCDCKFASPIWSHSEFVSLIKDAPTSFCRWVAGKLEKVKLHKFTALAWATWFCRNKAIFEPSQILDLVMTLRGLLS